jgi:hypothetical protein
MSKILETVEEVEDIEDVEVCPFCANDRNNRSTCCGEYLGEYGWIKLSEMEDE